MRNTLTTNKPYIHCLWLLALLSAACSRAVPSAPPAPVRESLSSTTEQCSSCHTADGALAGYMDDSSPMMRALSDFDPGRRDGLAACRSCHGGAALPASTATEAHRHGIGMYGLLDRFAANPTTDGVVDQVCGVCHRGHLDQLRASPMNAGPVAAADDSCTGACHVFDQGHSAQSGCSVCHSPRLPLRGGGESFDHRLMGSGKRPMSRAPLYAGELTVGVPEAGCLQCHSGGYQVALRYLGASTQTPATRSWEIREGLYRPKRADVHRARGLQCQDCHSSYDIHGPEAPEQRANAVEIECSDCHGTAEARPWQLPLGYMDAPQDATSPRDTARMVLAIQRHGQPAPRTADFAGYLRTARGTPIKKVLREGDAAVLYDATGQRHPIPALSARPGHDAASAQRQECYSCHSRAVLAHDVPLAPGKDGLLAPVIRSAGYADGSTLPPAPYTPHDVVRK